MSRRNPGAGGLTFVQANAGRVEQYTFDPEVSAAKARIERDYPRLQILWDKETLEHLIVQTDLHGTQSLLFATRSFHEDLIRSHIEACNNEKRDAFEEVEKHNARLDKAIDDRMTERVHEAGEKLAFAFAQDGLTVRPRVAFTDTPLYKKRAIRNFEAPTRMIANRR